MAVAALILVAASGGVVWWQAVLAEERHANRVRSTQQIEDLLSRCEMAIAADDADGARLAVGDVEKREGDADPGAVSGRLARCRSAADQLAALDRIDDMRWNTENGKFRGTVRAVREWPAVFARLGVVAGQTPTEEAAALINDSLASERLLAALDLWLVLASPAERASLARLLAVADPDPFRDAVREAVQRSDWASVKRLAGRDDAMSQPPRFATALGSIAEVPITRKLALLSTAARLRPRAFAVLMTAGDQFRINDRTTAADRVAWYRSAVGARPGSCVARDNLGVALRDKGDLDGSIAEFRIAIGLDPMYAMAHNNLGVALKEKGNLGAAITEYRTAITLDPNSFLAHTNLGNSLFALGDLDGAVVEHRTAVLLKPNSAPAHSNLGYTLQSQGNMDEAISEFRTAIALDRKHALAYYNLANALKETGDLDGAIAAFGEADRLGLKGVGPRRAEVERWKRMLPKLDDVASSRVQPINAAEAAEFANLCRQPFLKRHAASARLYAKACTIEAKYATDASTFDRRYDAARSAALAGNGRGKDPPSDKVDREALREQALAWLETNRILLARRLSSNTSKDRKYVTDRLSAWQSEKDLAITRSGVGQDGWSSVEGAAWAKFWLQVRTLLAKAVDTSKSPSLIK